MQSLHGSSWRMMPLYTNLDPTCTLEDEREYRHPSKEFQPTIGKDGHECKQAMD